MCQKITSFPFTIFYLEVRTRLFCGILLTSSSHDHTNQFNSYGPNDIADIFCSSTLLRLWCAACITVLLKQRHMATCCGLVLYRLAHESLINSSRLGNNNEPSFFSLLIVD